METGRVIQGRYLLQRLIKQTAFCSVYQGMDQRLQRAVAVKSVLSSQSAVYRTAAKMTASFSHPHIVGLYDLIIESDSLYVVQEHIEGDSFETLMQSHLNAYDIAQMGWQMCLALTYAGSSSRRVCHGDLVPSAVIRDKQGSAHINGFALPTDTGYFQKWSALGSEGVALLETELPWGQQSEGRRADDTRAVGLLLYQLATGSQEPPTDGRLRFSRGTPPELCETIARVVIRPHPQNINTPEVLYPQLKALAESLEPPIASPAAVASYQQEEPLVRQFSPAGVGKMAPALPGREAEQAGRGVPYSGPLPPLASPAPLAPTVANRVSLESAGQRPGYATPAAASSNKFRPALMILLIGLLAFALFFVVGYFLGHTLIP